MTPFFWIGVVALIAAVLLALSVIAELRAIRGLLFQMLGSLAEAGWRVRDELTAINKRKDT